MPHRVQGDRYRHFRINEMCTHVICCRCTFLETFQPKHRDGFDLTPRESRWSSMHLALGLILLIFFLNNPLRLPKHSCNRAKVHFHRAQIECLDGQSNLHPICTNTLLFRRFLQFAETVDEVFKQPVKTQSRYREE
jgi:hypothetical protein